MMDEECGVMNRRNRRRVGANKRKSDERRIWHGLTPSGGADDLSDEQSSYLTVTSADFRCWFRNLGGAVRGVTGVQGHPAAGRYGWRGYLGLGGGAGGSGGGGALAAVSDAPPANSNADTLTSIAAIL